MNSYNKGVVVCGALGLALSGSAVAQNLFQNAGFENGNWNNSTQRWAGQTANVVANSGTDNGSTTSNWSITAWSFATSDNGNRERWITDDDSPYVPQGNSVANQRYIFLSTTATTSNGQGNACLRYSFNSNAGLNFTAGTTYQFSFLASDAGTTGSADPLLGFEIIGGGGSNVSQFASIPRVSNGWVNSSASGTSEPTVTWNQYTFNWTPSVNYTGAAFYWSLYAGANGSTANVIFDNVSLTTVVPEAHTVAAGIFMAGLVGSTIYRRRKAQA